MLYRNYPRDFRYQIFIRQAAARRQLLHLQLEHADRPDGLPAGGHLVVAPYVTASRRRAAARRRSARR